MSKMLLMMPLALAGSVAMAQDQNVPPPPAVPPMETPAPPPAPAETPPVSRVLVSPDGRTITYINNTLPPPPPGQQVYPPCSATLRDQCTQMRAARPARRRARD